MQTIKGAVYSIKGNVRRRNDDNYYLFEQIRSLKDENSIAVGEARETCICAVFDGVGGMEHGNEAAFYAADFLNQYEERVIEACNDKKNLGLKSEILQMNEKICEKAKEIGNMGTTIALISVNKDTIYTLNLGDSRIYHIGNQGLQQLSKDHNMAQFLLELNIISSDVCNKHRGKHELTQYLGINKEEMLIEPYVYSFEKTGKKESFLLCTDGLLDGVEEQELYRILQKNSSLELKQQLESVVHRAVEKGSRDNVTAMIIEVME